MSSKHTSGAPTRLSTVLGFTSLALSELRSTTTAGALSVVLAECWRVYLGPIERAFLMTAAAHAVEPDVCDKMGQILNNERMAKLQRLADIEAEEIARARPPNWAEPPHTQMLGYIKPPNFLSDADLIRYGLQPVKTA